MAEQNNPEIRHNAAEHRFETEVEGETAVLVYHLGGGKIDLEHTIVPPAIERQGIGSALVRAALEHARARELRVIPSCPFVQTYLERHPEYQPLTARE